MATAEQIRAGIDGYIETMSAADTEGVIALFAESAYLEDPVGAQRSVGLEAIRAHFTAATQQTTSTLTLEAPIRVAEPTWGAATMQARTAVGDQVYVIDITDIFTFDDAGKITSMTAYWGQTNMVINPA